MFVSQGLRTTVFDIILVWRGEAK